MQNTEKIVTYTSKWRKVFWASLSLSRLVLRYRFADYESTRLQDYEWLTLCASLTLRRLRVHETTRLQVADALGFAVASQTTSGSAIASQTCASLTLRRLLVYKTTRQQVAAAVLVVSLTRCLVVRRSHCLVVWHSQGLVD